LLAGESVLLEGIGTFSRIHEPQHFSRDEKGRTVAHPPKDTVQFSPEELGERE
jgi:nucleoid DNA-binding protein